MGGLEKQELGDWRKQRARERGWGEGGEDRGKRTGRGRNLVAPRGTRRIRSFRHSHVELRRAASRTSRIEHSSGVTADA
eukprot:602106-Pleurochrysis_carterae.AAC.1